MDLYDLVKLFETDVREIRRDQRLILKLLFNIQRGERIMTAELDTLTAEVARNTSVEASAAALIKGIADQLAAAVASNDAAALTDLTGKLSASADALAAAVTANTPVVVPAPVAQTAPVVVAEPATPAA